MQCTYDGCRYLKNATLTNCCNDGGETHALAFATALKLIISHCARRGCVWCDPHHTDTPLGTWSHYRSIVNEFVEMHYPVTQQLGFGSNASPYNNRAESKTQ